MVHCCGCFCYVENQFCEVVEITIFVNSLYKTTDQIIYQNYLFDVEDFQHNKYVEFFKSFFYERKL